MRPGGGTPVRTRYARPVPTAPGRAGPPAADRLVAATRELMTERKPADITVRAIAVRAGVQHSLIARHFGSRDALLATVVAQVLADVGEDAAAAPDLDAALDTITDQFSKKPALTRAIGTLVSQGTVPAARDHPIVHALERHLAASQVAPPRRREVAVAIIVAVFGWTLAESWWLHILDDTDDPVAGRRVLRHTVDAILADAESTGR